MGSGNNPSKTSRFLLSRIEILLEHFYLKGQRKTDLSLLVQSSNVHKQLRLLGKQFGSHMWTGEIQVFGPSVGCLPGYTSAETEIQSRARMHIQGLQYGMWTSQEV